MDFIANRNSPIICLMVGTGNMAVCSQEFPGYDVILG